MIWHAIVDLFRHLSNFRVFKRKRSQEMADEELQNMEAERQLADGGDAQPAQGMWLGLPTEIWVDILSRDHSPFKPQGSAGKRMVCKRLRDVIDANLEFRLTIDDTKLDVTKLGHLRVKHLIIKHLVTDRFRRTPIFRDTSCLQELNIWGPITPKNFRWLMNQTPEINKLSLNDASLKFPNLLNPGSNVNDCWKNLKCLVITISITVKPEFYATIFRLPVSSVEQLTLYGDGLQSFTDNFTIPFFAFISRMRNLKKLQMQYYKVSPNQPAQPILTQELEGIQLQSLRLITSSKVLRGCLPFLKIQNQLSVLRIVDKHYTPQHENISVHLFDELGSMLTRNQNSLSCLEFIKLRLSKPLDCAIFEEMKQLKRLVLQRFAKSSDANMVRDLAPPHIRNLQLLPTSLETISLGRLWCDSTDLSLMAGRLGKIQRLELKYVGETNHERVPLFGANQDVLERIARKRSCKRVLMDPLAMDNFNIVSNNLQRFVAVNGVMVEIFNRNESWGENYIEFDFENARA